MPKTTLTITLDTELKEKFSRFAQAANTSESELVRRLMREHISGRQPRPGFMPPENCTEEEYDAWFREQVQIGREQAGAGLLIPHEEVEAHFAQKRAELRRKLGMEE